MNFPGKSDSVSAFVKQGLQRLSVGKISDVLNSIEQILKHKPTSGTVWSDAGILLFSMGRTQEALRHFLRSLQYADFPRDIYIKLIHVYLALQRPQSAFQLMDAALAEGFLDESLALRISESFMEQNDPAGAMETVLKAADRLTEKGLLHEQAAAIRQNRAKVAFFVGNDGPTFLNDIIEYAAKRFQVRVFDGQTTRQLAELMEWSDISWFEWCTNLAQTGSQFKIPCRKIIRLHRYEAYLPVPQQICWENIDYLITVGNSFVVRALEKWVPDIRRKVGIVTIPNGVNLNKIPFIPRGKGNRLAFVASLRMVKNPMYLLQCMAKLHRVDPTYRLFIAGDKPDLLLEQYMDYAIRELGLEGAVIFDGWQKDITAWLADKNYLVITSVIESQGMGCLEAMAAGICPIIHNFPGSKETFGDTYLFNTPEEFCRKIISDEYNSLEYREFVENRYPLDRQLLKINEVLACLEAADRGAGKSLESEGRILQAAHF